MSAILKCKMCGGDMHMVDAVGICECEYCGSRQTVPLVNDEKRTNLFNRANRLRMSNEYDKAAGIYESLIAEFPNEAEAYWGLCLCKYGIEYVDDPKTAEKIPTCHRTSYTSIFADSDYKLAIEHADDDQHKLYDSEAHEIDRLQKAILDIARNEKPYDVFICYKETDENGDRTKESVYGQDIYDSLVNSGLKVFFSRITLESKLGQEYEPYIFSALNSARVMLVVGTSYDNITSVWVKNEWGRFLDLMKKDKKRTLIPCYEGIDAYDLPEEFKNLQGQDLAKLGAIQDITRGVIKLLERDKSLETTTVPIGNVTTYIKRGNLALEDHEWSNAVSHFEKALDIDPENADSYIGLFLASLKMPNLATLSESTISIKDLSEYKKAIRFATGDILKALEDVADQIEDRIRAAENEIAYQSAVSKMTEATSAKSLYEVAGLFRAIEGYKDSADKVHECERRAEQIEKDRKRRTTKASRIALITTILVVIGVLLWFLGKNIIITRDYSEAEYYIDNHQFERAIEIYQKYDDDAAVSDCIKKEVEHIDTNASGEYYQSLMECLEFVNDGEFVEKSSEKIKYYHGLALYESGDYKSAIDMLSACDYEDNPYVINSCYIALAEEYAEQDDYQSAVDVLVGVPQDEVILNKLMEYRYLAACQAFDKKLYYAVANFLRDQRDYKDSESMYIESVYQLGIDSYNKRKWEDAANYLIEAGDYKDALEFVDDAKYQYVLRNKNPQNELTAQYLAELSAKDYEDSVELTKEIFSWKVTDVKVINKLQDGVVLDSMGLNCEYTLAGGLLGDSTDIYVKLVNSSGFETPLYENAKNTKAGTKTIKYTYSLGGKGTLTIIFYDSDKNEIGRFDVRVK